MRKGSTGYIIVGLAIIIVAFGFLYMNGTLNAIAQGLGLTGLTVGPGGQPLQLNCPDTKLTAISTDVFNGLNTTGSENYDMTIVFTSNKGDVQTITDTTNPTAVNFNCGETYTGKGVSSSGAGGDHGVFTKVLSGNAVISNGDVVFTANGGSMNFELESTQHGRVEARVFDNDNNAFVFDAGSADGSAAGTYRTTGTYFQSTTNATAITVGAGGSLDLRMDVRVNSNSDQKVKDRAWYLFIDASTTIWDTPGVSVAGIARTSNCAILNQDEAKAFSGEEYCYRIEDVDIINTPVTQIPIAMKALAGVNPGASDDFNITIVSVGQYRSNTQQSNVKIGAVQDDSSQTVVLNQEEYRVDVA